MVGADNFHFSGEQILYHYTKNRDMLMVKWKEKTIIREKEPTLCMIFDAIASIA
jgi:hypothetical protein